MEIQSIGIVGAGQMGNGIAHVMALAGYDVLMTDVSAEALQNALELVNANMSRQAGRGKITEAEKDQALARMKTTQTLTDLGQSDLIIEAATERETVKQAIFEDLLPVLKPTTILTSNTSSISITRLASRTDRPERFMGFHFMNPVPVMQLVELIRGIATNEETFAACKAVVDRLGKTAASAEDFDADDQRGRLYTIRRRREREIHRQFDEAGCQSSNGSAGAGGFHRAGHLSCHHERAA